MPVILIVDDEPDLLALMRDILEVSGYSVATARNGREALDYLLKHARPAVIFLDLTMPIMNGLTFLQELRSGKHITLVSIPVVVISAVDKHVDLVAFDCAAIIQKPAELATILSQAQRFAPQNI
jgi:CheY-like chemotaxis protein